MLIREDLYILGTDSEYGQVVIRSTKNGEDWGGAVDLSTRLGGKRWHCAPMPVVLHNHRLWRCFEEFPEKVPRALCYFLTPTISL